MPYRDHLQGASKQTSEIQTQVRHHDQITLSQPGLASQTNINTNLTRHVVSMRTTLFCRATRCGIIFNYIKESMSIIALRFGLSPLVNVTKPNRKWPQQSWVRRRSLYVRLTQELLFSHSYGLTKVNLMFFRKQLGFQCHSKSPHFSVRIPSCATRRRLPGRPTGFAS